MGVSTWRDHLCDRGSYWPNMRQGRANREEVLCGKLSTEGDTIWGRRARRGPGPAPDRMVEMVCPYARVQAGCAGDNNGTDD